MPPSGFRGQDARGHGLALRDAEDLPPGLPKSAAATDGIACLLSGRGVAWIAVGDGKVGQVGEVDPKSLPQRVGRQQSFEQRHEIVNTPDLKTVFRKRSFEILFRTLLSMEADAVPGRIFRTRPSRSITAKSASALAIHSAVRGCIQEFSVLQDVPHKRIAQGQPLLDHLRGSHKQVDREGRPDRHPNGD